ncbi:MAG: RNA polymerase sporulation sigma factor SigK [Bacilli bacterium]|nr:RNA polymerase sporulation sigma factor SigK [Bacilli bacterium]
MFYFTGSYSNNIFPDPLSLGEEEKYIKLMENGDNDARSMLIEHNLRLVAHIVKKFETKVNDTDDLISIGTIGLIKGIDSFNSEKNIRITTYVARCIENEIFMYFRSNKKFGNDVSLNDSIGMDKDGNEISLIDVLPDNNSIEEEIDRNFNIELLNKHLNVLNKREKEIIIKRYGLFGNEEFTQRDIADEMNISRSYVSRIEKRALTKLLRAFYKNNK